MTHRWWSQPFPPEGSVASDGILRQLGAPALDPLVVLLRETAQNSWDARLDEAGVVELEYGVYRLGEQAQTLRDVLLPGPAGDLPGFADGLNEESSLIRVSDRHTTGLGGPLRSDEVGGSEPRNFVNFVRNAGEARDRDFGGGTYGFGKGALFRVSRSGVILVDTLCRHDGGVQRRLIAAALGSAHILGGRRHTGRHWWGDIAADGIVDPLLDRDAAEVATALGLRGFDDGVTGTDVYILDADLGESDAGDRRSRRQAAEVLASAGLWYLWPKLLPDRPYGRIDLGVRVDARTIDIPSPESELRLVCFVDALRSMDAGAVVPHTRKTPPKSVGSFASATHVWIDRPPGVVDAAAPFAGPAHHCARMRHIELVVDYLPGDEPGDPSMQYGAVFRASDDEVTEACFAAAEPPTHDAWNTQHLSGIQKGVVTGARTFVRNQLADIANPEGLRAAAGGQVPLGSVSSALAALLPDGGGDGADGPDGSGGGGGGGGGGSRVRAKGRPALIIRNGEAVVAQQVAFEQVNRPITARARADVAVDGGTERTAPTGASAPTVLGWEDAEGQWRDGDLVVVGPDDPRTWTAYVRPASDTSTILRVREVQP